MTFGAIPEDRWSEYADWGILERFEWIIPYLADEGVDAIWVDDATHSSTKHRSLAVLNPDVVMYTETVECIESI